MRLQQGGEERAAAPPAEAARATGGQMHQAFVQRKIHQRALQRKSDAHKHHFDRHDVSTDRVNPDHPGTVGGHEQSSRLGDLGKPITITADTPVYDEVGHTIGLAQAGPLGGAQKSGVNAGAISDIKPKSGPQAGKEVPAVLVFGAKDKNSGSAVTGWVALDHLSPRPALEKTQEKIDERIDHVRGSDHGHHYDARTVVHRTAESAGVEELYIRAGQQDKVQNKAKYFFFKSGDVANLFLNLPHHGHSGYVGVANDVVPAGAHFHEDKSVAREHIPLYHLGGHKQTGHLTMVYGYVVNSGGDKRYGWLNHALLG